MTVWIVSLEWNFPPSEVTGETGIVSVHGSEESARKAQRAEQEQLHAEGRKVYQFSPAEGDEDPDEWDIDVHCEAYEVKP